MKNAILIFVLFIGFKSFSQGYELSLSDNRIPTDGVNFSIAQLMDARKHKSDIGWVQTGLANTKRYAVLKNGFDGEVKQLFERSGLLDNNNPDSGLTVLVSRIYIRELTKATSEIARAEVGLSFFKRINADTCYFLASISGLHESKGMDVTYKHDENISIVFGKVLQDFQMKFSQQGIPAGNPVPVS